MNFYRPPAQRVVVELTALVDVTFLLIIFLLLTTRFANEAQIRVNLPQAVGEEKQQSIQNIEVVVDGRGRYWVEGAAIRPPSLRSLMSQILDASDGDRTVLVRIRADEYARHRDVVKVMDAASRLGFARISIEVLDSGAAEIDEK